MYFRFYSNLQVSVWQFLGRWMGDCRCPTGRVFRMSSTAGCGAGLTCSPTTSWNPLNAASSPLAPNRRTSVSTLTTTGVWRLQVQERICQSFWWKTGFINWLCLLVDFEFVLSSLGVLSALTLSRVISASTSSGSTPQWVQPSAQFTGQVQECLPEQRATDATECHLPGLLPAASRLLLLLLSNFLPRPITHLTELPQLPHQLCRTWQSVSHHR